MTKNPLMNATAPSRANRSSGHTAGVKFRQRWSLRAPLVALSLLVPTAAFAQPQGFAPPDLLAAPPVRPPQNAPPRRIAPLPAPPSAIPAATPQADPNAPKEPSVEERALRGIVMIERAGQPLSLGAVLAGDGRILTALSPLASGNDLEARFADGTVVRVKLGHHDRTWDLALLVPQTGRWKEGLVASTRDPLRQDATIRSFAMGKGKPLVSTMVIRGRRNLLGADDATLGGAFELGSRVSPLDLGAPIIDEDGRVVALLGRGCAPNENRPCTPVAFGIPINPIRNFLRTVPPTAVPPAAWLGIQGVADVSAFAKGVRIQGIHPDSPAAEAQLKAGDPSSGDMILAVDGVPVTTPEALAEAIHNHAVGEKVPLTVFGQGKYRQVTIVLRQAPDPRAAAQAPAHPSELPTLGSGGVRQPRPRPELLERRK